MWRCNGIEVSRAYWEKWEEEIVRTEADSFAPNASRGEEPGERILPNCVNKPRERNINLSRLEKDQSGIELMNSVKGEFVNLSEELTDDAVSIEDIDEVLQTLE